jgi:hypothetical protein
MNIVLNIEEAQLREVLAVLGRTGDAVNIVINIKEEKPRDVRTKNMSPERGGGMKEKSDNLTIGLVMIAIGLALFLAVEVRDFFSYIDKWLAFALTLVGFSTLFIGIAVTISYLSRRKPRKSDE